MSSPGKRHPLAYTGRVRADTDQLGDAEFDENDFSVYAGRVSLAVSAAIQTLNADTGSAAPAANAVTFSGGEGIDTSGSGSTITIAGEDASDSNKGIASFTAGDFSVSSGAVSLAATVPKSIATDGSAAIPAASAFTIAGGTGLTTSGSGSTVTVALDTPVSVADGGSGAVSQTAYAVLCGGTTATGAYQSIASVGSSGQVLTSNGAGALPTFQAAATGDVTKVGTPADSQIGVWTGDGTIEGDADFTFDTSTDTLRIAASGNIAFGAVNVLSDSAGTTTLSNIDALDATTESTIESAIDTLSNLTSASSLATIGTISTGTWEATDVGVAHGGSGRSSHTEYAVLCGGTTTTAAQQSIASVGTSGQVLTSNGAGALPTFQNAAAGGGSLVHLLSSSPSGASSVDFNSTYITTTYDHYIIYIRQLAPSDDAVDLNLYVSDDNLSTVETANYDCETFLAGSTNSSTVSNRVLIAESIGNATGETISGEIHIINPEPSGTYTAFYGTTGFMNDGGGNELGSHQAHYEVAATINGLRLQFSAGTMTGNVILYGVAES